MTAGACRTASNLPPLRAKGRAGGSHCSEHKEESAGEDADRDVGVRRAKGGQDDGAGVYPELNGVYSELRGMRGVSRRFALFRQVTSTLRLHTLLGECLVESPSRRFALFRQVFLRPHILIA